MSAPVLPAGWSAVSIIDAAERIMDFRGRTPKKLGMDWGGGDIPAISARNVRMGRIDFSEEFYLGSDALYRRWMTHGDMERGDVLITTEAPLGNVAPVPDDRRYILSQRTVLIRPKRDLFDKIYFLKALQSPGFQRLLTENATGSTALGIQRRRLERLAINAPPLCEQRRIGQALQGFDELIAMLERLIAKKQAIKQGMMQQLLTGRTRLPGFHAEWTTAPLKEFLPLQRGFDLPTSQVQPGPYPVVYSNGVARHHAKAMVSGPGVVTGRSGTIGRVHHIDQDYWPHNTSLWVTSFARVEALFAYYFLSYLGLERFASGSGVPTFNRNDAHSFPVTLPTDRGEQAAIAEVLRDADGELSALTKRLAKARGVKQGMMQQLLTGRTRLPIQESAA
jgi:type I restriction enzyme, S subunit